MNTHEALQDGEDLKEEAKFSYTVPCSKASEDVLNLCENFRVFFVFWGLSHERMLGSYNALKWKQYPRFSALKF